MFFLFSEVMAFGRWIVVPCLSMAIRMLVLVVFRGVNDTSLFLLYFREDLFAYSPKDMLGVNPSIIQHSLRVINCYNVHTLTRDGIQINWHSGR